MSTFYELYLRQCAINKIAASRAAEEMGFSRNIVNGWKNGKQPNASTIARVAEYFKVTTTYFTGHEPIEFNLQLFAPKAEPSAQEKKLVEIYHSLDEIGKAKLLAYASELLP